VFLIDSYKLQKFDFDLLERRLVEDVPKLKKAAFVLSLQAASKEMISLKVAELRSRMWKQAALSAGLAAIPNASVHRYRYTWHRYYTRARCIYSIVTAESEFYFTQLGLDEISLRRYARLTNADYKKLKAIVVSSFGGFEIPAIVDTCVRRVAMPTAAEEGLRFIPLIGSLIAAPLSFAGTYYALQLVLEKMERVALEVVECVAESAASACCD